MSDILELPLKASQETFCDEPKEIGDVNIHDLVIDIQNHSTTINKLHIFQAITVFLYTLEDIMKLQKHPKLFDKFRMELLSQNGKSHFNVSDNNDKSIRSSTPPNSCSEGCPPTKVLKTHDAGPINQPFPEGATPESLDDSIDGNDNNDNNDNKNNNNSPDNNPDNNNPDNNNPDNHNDFLSLQTLLESTDLNQSYEIDFTDITAELKYYQDPKVKSQNEYVLKTFNLLKPPNLSVQMFLERIKTYSPSISALCYIHAAFLMFKLCILNQVIELDFCNVYRLILGLIRCLTKKLEDIFQKQKTFATVGGVSTNDLLRIEVGFLFLCNFKLVVNENCLDEYLKNFGILRDFVKQNVEDHSAGDNSAEDFNHDQ